MGVLRSSLGRFTPVEKAAGTHSKRDWLCPRAGLDTQESR